MTTGWAAMGFAFYPTKNRHFSNKNDPEGNDGAQRIPDRSNRFIPV
jgi:hypothetical protein